MAMEPVRRPAATAADVEQPMDLGAREALRDLRNGLFFSRMCIIPAANHGQDRLALR